MAGACFEFAGIVYYLIMDTRDYHTHPVFQGGIPMAEEIKEKSNFIWEAIKSDLAEGKNGGRVQTRFPP